MSEGPPKKPPEGQACNGCGLCCALQPCPIAVELLQAVERPCPALEFGDGRFWCGLARTPSRYLDTPRAGDRPIGAMVRLELGIGEGCDTGA